MKIDESYWIKDASSFRPAKDLSWNFPEQKTGKLSIIGGNSASFAPEIKISEFLSKNYPFIKTIENVFPDSLKKNLPNLENFSFFESTDSGSFKRTSEFKNSLEDSDFGLIFGDLSKNSETSIAILELIKNTKTPILMTRDSIDLVANDFSSIIMKENLTLVASLAQLQKIFRALYYPKMILLSAPLLPTIETLHKFTLSYPVSILTFHELQIICAKNGRVAATPIDKTEYTPLSLWSGEIAAKASVLQLFNKNSSFESLIASEFNI